MKRFKFKASPLSNIIRIGLLVWILGIIVFKVDTTKMIFKKTVEELKGPNITDTMTNEQYNEVVNLGRRMEQERQMQQTQEIEPIINNERETALIVKDDNRVFVHVTIGYRGKMVTVPLLIDTGATGITITPSIANRLGISEADTTKGISTVADGRKTQHYNIDVAFVAVGPKTKKPLQIHIMPNESFEDSGLLGMSFLGEFPYMLDMKAKVIRWM